MNKRPIIIDTDPGIDDALAIAIALFSEELDIRLISTVAGNVGLDKVTYNALRLLKYFGREDVPVAVGADRPLIREFEDASSVHGKSGMEGFDFEEPTQQPLKENAVDAMRNVIMNSSEPVTLVPIAPLDQYRAAVEDLPRGEAEYP
ncbi:MAG: nucleoside hydrolase [[Clostridium] innocuum]